MSSSRRASPGVATVIAQSEEHRRRGRRAPAPAPDGDPALPSDDADAGPSADVARTGLAVATAADPSGMPVHRGWAPAASHHRWLEPFVLMALANGHSHGYAIIGALTEVGINGGSVDVGQVYRTLRDLEQGGQVQSTWATGSGAARRDYRITELGSRALDEWAAVMKERARLIAEFDAAYLSWVFDHRES